MTPEKLLRKATKIGVTEFDYAMIEAYKAAFMKLDEIKKPAFDPEVRIKEAKMLNVILTPYDWFMIEKELGRHVTAMEIRELIMAVFTGSHKIVKR